MNYFLNVIRIISFIGVLFFSIFGIIEQLFGARGVERAFQKIGIGLSYNWFLIIGFICLAIFFITSIILKKL